MRACCRPISAADELKCSLAEPLALSRVWSGQRCTTLLDLFTVEGIVGWSEAFALGIDPPEIVEVESGIRMIMR